jgi:adenylate kinase
MKNIILLGKPCSGKGTISKLLIEKGYYHLSGSDILRENSQSKVAPYYKEAIYALTSGVLISDDIMNGMVSHKISQLKGQPIVFDGFPRSINQAEELLSLFPDLTQLQSFYLDISDNDILERVTNRLTCKCCAASYNTTNMKPQKEGVCDLCQGEVYRRTDDNIDTLKKRLSQYSEQTEPVIHYMKQKIQHFDLTNQQTNIQYILSR